VVQGRFEDRKKEIPVFQKRVFQINEVFCRRNDFYESSEVYCLYEEMLIGAAQSEPSQNRKKKRTKEIKGFFLRKEEGK
jgi:hypothetical protein